MSCSIRGKSCIQWRGDHSDSALLQQSAADQAYFEVNIQIMPAIYEYIHLLILPKIKTIYYSALFDYLPSVTVESADRSEIKER